jgi:hypothetical protein
MKRHIIRVSNTREWPQKNKATENFKGLIFQWKNFHFQWAHMIKILQSFDGLNEDNWEDREEMNGSK